MKKTLLLSFTMIYLLCITLTCFAAPASAPVLTVEDAANDVINVSGKVDSPEYVTLILLNPEKTEADINFADSDAMASAVQYIGTCWAEGGEYSFDVPMYGTSGGVFTAIITAGNEKYDDTPTAIKYFFSNEKKQVIVDINDADDEEDIEGLLVGGVDEDGNRFNGAFTLYSMAEDKLYTQGDVLEIAKVVEKTRDDDGDFNENDVNTFSRMLKISSIIGAYNANLPEIVITDDYLDYVTELGIEDSDAHNDYLDMLSEDGRVDLHKDLINNDNTYYTVDDIADKFTELIAYHGIVNHKESGYGHIDHYFETYADIYEEAGFDLDDLKSNKKNSVYKSLIKKDTSDLDDLKDAFNKLVEESNESSNKGGSGSGSGSSGSGYTPPPVTKPQDTNYIKPESFFIDIETVEWAHEAILGLADLGVVNGIGNNCFAPNNNVTRAQFMKMLMDAVDIVGDNADIAFEDVANNHWAKKYIASAVKNNIANGMSETEFSPEGNVTREQAAAFIARAVAKKGGVLTADSNVFSDNDKISSWAAEAVNGLKNAGVISGSGDNMFNPKNNLTRAEAANMIYGLMNYLGLIEVAE